jgi:hypothetical protein
MAKIVKKENKLSIISKCTDCGAPIYGAKTVKIDEEPVVKFSCDCRLKTTNLGIQYIPQPIYIQPYIPYQCPTITCGPAIGIGSDLHAIGDIANYSLDSNIQYSLTSY